MIKELLCKILRTNTSHSGDVKTNLGLIVEPCSLKKHICILFCYNNYEHIRRCFESIYDDKTDYFIVENYSSNSEDIKRYFLNKKITGYIQFEQNITNNAANIFLKDFGHLLKEYRYITFSDCDLLVHDKESLFCEIFKNLEYKDVIVSCADLEIKNLPKVPGSENWIPKGIETDNYIECFTGVHFLTIKNENLSFFENVHFLDSCLHSKTKSLKKKWVKTIVNKTYHLTWDLYFKGNDYFDFKVKNSENLWNHSNTCNYTVIV